MDDVVTTGSTVAEIARRCLRRARRLRRYGAVCRTPVRHGNGRIITDYRSQLLS
ncbi:hypothetical protein M8494_30435 [Serratia ureilytica]